MKLVEPISARRIVGVEVPKELYWVLEEPSPLAAMRFPRSSFPWSTLKASGFSDIVSLDPGPYDPEPLTKIFSEKLEDLISGGAPRDEEREKTMIKSAVTVALSALYAGRGVLVHCVGGRGRSGTVIGCLLRELGFAANEIVPFLDRVHKARGKPGWPESPWQSSLVIGWRPGA